MADQQFEPTGDARVDALINDPAYQEAVALLLKQRVDEVREHHAALLAEAGHAEAAAFLRDLDT